MSRIISIGTAVPLYVEKQDNILNFMNLAYNNTESSRKLNALFHFSGIHKRYSVLPDFKTNAEGSLFSRHENELPSVDKRLDIFKERVMPLAIDAIQDAFAKIHSSDKTFGITHLITVTCTGMHSPGLDSELIEQLHLPVDTFHMAVNFLGCNAAFHALKIADMIVKTDINARILVVCVELCSIHFQPKNNPDNLLSNTLFGDGAAAVLITADQEATTQGWTGVDIHGFYSLVLNQGRHLMGWNITPVNFEMILDPKIPEFIGDEINDLVQKATKRFQLGRATFDFWAIHPGGKKILDILKKRLSLNDDDLHYSYKVLHEYGNMSSPTIMFVINEFMKPEHVHQPGQSIFSVGFGPGLSIETALLTYAN